MKFFTTKLVVKITGATPRQLQYWDETDLITPSVMRPCDCSGKIRIYNFTNLVETRTIMKLKSDGMSIQKIRRSLGYLQFRYSNIEKPLAQMTLITNGESIFLLTADYAVDTLRKGQRIFKVVFEDIVKELRGQIVKFRPVGKQIDYGSGTHEVYQVGKET